MCVLKAESWVLAQFTTVGPQIWDIVVLIAIIHAMGHLQLIGGWATQLKKNDFKFVNIPPNIPAMKTFNTKNAANIHKICHFAPPKKKTNLPRPASLSTVTSESRVDRWLHNCSPWARGKLRGCRWLAKHETVSIFKKHVLFPGNYIWHFTECVNIMYYINYMYIYIHPWYHVYIYTYL